MEDWEIDKKLKESADRIQVQDFESRREILKKRIAEQESSGNDEVGILDPVPVTAEGGAYSVRRVNKKTLLLAAFVLVCVITLAIVLPLVLRKGGSQAFYTARDLNEQYTTESDFYTQLQESEIELINISKFSIDSYSLLIDPENTAKGGRVSFLEDSTECFVDMKFYDISVTGIEEAEEDYSEYIVNGSSVKYKTVEAEDAYNTVAVTQYKSVNYYMEIVSVTENVGALFQNLFGE